MAQFPNASRGLHVAGTDFVYLSEGAYGVIFVDRARNRICKIAKRRSDAKMDHCRDVFMAEVSAYEVASKSDELRPLVPTFFGVCDGGQIIDADGTDASGEFYPEFAFEAEFVDCTFEKIARCAPAETNQIITLFQKHGINHVIDMSVCLKNGQIDKVIDFALKEHELWWD